MPTNSQLKEKALGLLAGNKATLERLIVSESARHKGESLAWYLDKVIYQLERDRGL